MTKKCPYCGGSLEQYQDSTDEFICEDCGKVMDVEEAI
jgi:uncharacterized protein YbaR (Trm112 family)